MHEAGRSTNRTWLGDFLRSRRERLSPEAFGLPAGRRRRSPGLRREEVAQLSGISIAYYTWIEQGRDINISADVLNGIARTLGLSEAESMHLFALVGVEIPQQSRDDEIHPTISQLLGADSARWCGLMYDECFNVLESTRLATAIFGLRPGSGLDSNLMFRLFCERGQHTIWVDWETEARLIVGMFRHVLAKHPGSSAAFQLLETLLGISAFAALWNAYDVSTCPSPEEFFRREPWQLSHRDRGLMHVNRLALAMPSHVNQTLVLYSAADASTFEKFRDILESENSDKQSVSRSERTGLRARP
jgi:transcriptional regulator with XRE-family HTH domain